jgi:hypothetical protein
MSNKPNKFENFEQLDSFIAEASASELHEVAIEHASCWETQEFCEADTFFYDETSELGELIFTRVIGAPKVSTETLIFALGCASQSTWHRAYLSSVVMNSPAITVDILLQIPVDDLIDDAPVADELIFHPISNAAVVLRAIDQFPNNLINTLVYKRFRDEQVTDEQKMDFKNQKIEQFNELWKRFETTAQAPTEEETARFIEFIEIAK